MRTTFPEYVVALATIVGSVLFSVSSLIEIGGNHWISIFYEIVNNLNTSTLPFPWEIRKRMRTEDGLFAYYGIKLLLYN